MKILFAVLLTMALFSPVVAQDTPEYACTDEEAAEFHTRVVDILTTADTSDITDLLDRFARAREIMAAARSVCSGYAFSGERGEIIGPVRFVAGVYIATITGDVFTSAEFTPVDGTCRLYIYVDEGQESETEVLEVRDDCRALIEVDADNAYTLAFELVE